MAETCEFVKVVCPRCGFELTLVLPPPSRRQRRPAMAAWSFEGAAQKACPNCRAKLARVSVERFKELVCGQCAYADS